MILGGLPPIFADKVAQKKEAEKAIFYTYVPEKEGEDENEQCKFENFRAAVEAHKDKVLRGLFALTDEEIAERRAEFYATFKPEEPYTDAEMAAFLEAYHDFTRMLEALQAEQRPERLITSSAESDNDEDDYKRSLLPSNPLLQQALKEASEA